MRWARQWHRQRRNPHVFRSVQSEQLEPRLLISANPANPSSASLKKVVDSQAAVVDGAQFPPGAFSAGPGLRNYLINRIHDPFSPLPDPLRKGGAARRGRVLHENAHVIIIINSC